MPTAALSARRIEVQKSRIVHARIPAENGGLSRDRPHVRREREKTRMGRPRGFRESVQARQQPSPLPQAMTGVGLSTP